MKSGMAGLVGAAAGMCAASAALANYTVTQGLSAPTYSTTLTFDEVGGPTGSVSQGAWLGSHGITDLNAGDSQPFVGDLTGTAPWVGSDNAFYGPFGVFITFANDLDAFSAQIWDPSGPPTFTGGGLGIVLFDNGVEVGSQFGITPAWGGVGSDWFNITADGGMVFDEVRILGFGFFPTTIMDNASWNVVPSPASASLLCASGLMFASRRRK